MTTPQYTDLQLKLFIARQVPELIYYSNGFKCFNFFSKDDEVTDPVVTLREWHSIVLDELVRKLTPDEMVRFWYALADVVNATSTLRGPQGYAHTQVQTILATWQQFTIAYAQTKGLKIVT